MASKQTKAKVRGPYDTAANWSASNRVLLQGEKVYAKVESGAVRSKTGDGTKTFSQLPYDDEAIYQSLSEKANATLSNVTDAVFKTKANSAGVGSGSSIRVAQSQPSGQEKNDVWYKLL